MRAEPSWMGLMLLWKRLQRVSSPFPYVKTQQRDHSLSTRKQVLTRHWIHQHLNGGLPSLQNWEISLSISQPVHDIFVNSSLNRLRHWTIGWQSLQSSSPKTTCPVVHSPATATVYPGFCVYSLPLLLLARGGNNSLLWLDRPRIFHHPLWVPFAQPTNTLPKQPFLRLSSSYLFRYNILFLLVPWSVHSWNICGPPNLCLGNRILFSNHPSEIQ